MYGVFCVKYTPKTSGKEKAIGGYIKQASILKA